MTGQRRLAAERLPHARAGAVLRRHLLPARAAPRDAQLAADPRRGRRRVGHQARRDPRAGREARPAPGRRGRAGAVGASRCTPPRSTPRWTSCARQHDPQWGGWGGAAEVPRRVGDRVPARPRGDRDVAGHAAGDGLRRDLRPGRRRLRPLRGRPRPGRSRTSRRCSTTTRCWPAPTCTAGRSAATRSCGGPATETLDFMRARAARARGRLLRGARRRLRGRRGQVLRLVARGAARWSSATTPTRPSPGSARPSAATSRARTSSRPAGPSRPPSSASGSAPRCWRRARTRVRPGPRRQAPDVLERAGDRRVRRRRRGPRARRLPRRRARRRRLRPRASCATPTGGCCAPGRTAAAGCDAYLEDHAFLLEALLDALRGDVRAALVRRGARAGRHDPRALRRPRARRLLLHRRRPRAARRPAQGPRGRPDPRRARRAPRSGCCASPR